MKVNIKVKSAYALPCTTSYFSVNNIDAVLDDFGTMEDIEPFENPEPYSDECYSCGNMQFISKPATKAVMEKYKLTLDEYDLICNILGSVFDIGYCGWCV